MRRLLAVFAAVLVAGLVVFLLQMEDRDDPAGAFVEEIATLIRLGKIEEARAEFQRIRDDLDDDDAFFAEGMVLVGESNYAAAEAPLREAVKAHPDDATVLDFYVAALLNQQKAAEAIAACESFVERHPKDPLGVWALAKSLADPALGERDLTRTLKLLDEVERLQKAAGDGVPQEEWVPRQFQVARLRATAASDLGRHVEAVEAGRVYAALQKDAWYAWALYASIARKAAFAFDPQSPHPNLLQLAAGAAAEAIKCGPPEDQLPMVQIEFIQLLLAIPDPGVVPVAVANADDLRKAYPGRTDFQILYARALVRTNEEGEMDEAAAVYESVLEKEPQNLTALRNLGVLLYDWKLGGQRGTYLERAHELLAEYVRLGGVVDRRLQDTMDTLARIAEGDAAATRAADGLALLKRAEQAADPKPLLREAVRLLEEAIQENPDQPAAWRGLLRALSGLLPETEERLEQKSREAVKRFPGDEQMQQARAEFLLTGLSPLTDEERAAAGDGLAARHRAKLEDLLEFALTCEQDASVAQMLVLGTALAGGTRLRAEIDAALPGLADTVPDLWEHVAAVEKQAEQPPPEDENQGKSGK